MAQIKIIMLQRIQTLFLLAATVFQVIFIFNPLAVFILDSNLGEAILYVNGLKNILQNQILIHTYDILILSYSVLILVTISIFLYKKRILQLRFCVFGMLLNIGQIALILYTVFSIQNQLTPVSKSFTIWPVIPLINIILNYLAFRGIRKDELLIKAYNRLR